jgi:hypothetical protein
MPSYANDLMLAVLGSSVGLGGLLLVFCGYVFAQAAGFNPEHTDDETIKKYKTAGTNGLWPFCGSMLNSLLVVIWFIFQRDWLYLLSLGLFAILLVVTAVYGCVVVRRYL